MVAMPFHILTYGDPGAGKTELAATSELPGIICNFDGLAKARPYFLKPMPMMGKRQVVPLPIAGKQTSLEMIRLYAQNDVERKTIQRIIYNLTDNDPENAPVAWLIFKDFIMPSIDETMNSIGGKTLIIDSGTTMQIAYRHYSKRYAPGNSEWSWAGPLTDELEILCAKLIGKPYNTIVVCHIAKEKENAHGYAESVAAMPGRMSRNILAMHDNTFRTFVDVDGKHYIQTQHDGRFIANNNMNAPAKCENSLPTAMKNMPVILLED